MYDDVLQISCIAYLSETDIFDFLFCVKKKVFLFGISTQYWCKLSSLPPTYFTLNYLFKITRVATFMQVLN